MNDSVVLLSSMSPKIKNKLMPGEKQFRRVAGASILALKKNIRRSSTYDRSVTTIKNEDLNLVESASSISVESFPSLQLKESIDDSVIIIPDSDCSDNSDYEYLKSNKSSNEKIDFKTNVDLLPKDKLAAISNWVANVNNIENDTISSAYTDLSTICGSELGNKLLPNEKGHAINSTFASGHYKQFDELFCQNNPPVVDESFKKMTIEDSFEILNESLTTRLKNSGFNDIDSKTFKNQSNTGSCVNDSGNWKSVQISERSRSFNTDDGINESIRNNLIKNNDSCKTSKDSSLRKAVESSEQSKSLNTDEGMNESIRNDLIINNASFETPKDRPLNKWKEVEISDDSGADENIAQNVLDELYGHSWRSKKDLILSKTEQKPKISKPDLKTTARSERKPKPSLLYKNPYIDSEKSKSQNLIDSLHKSKLKESFRHPWHERLKGLCDSDTNSESLSNVSDPYKKLDFEESSDDDQDVNLGTKSKYFKKKTKTEKGFHNKENNVNMRNRNKINFSSSGSSTDNSNSTSSTTSDKPSKNILNKKSDLDNSYERLRLRVLNDFFNEKNTATNKFPNQKTPKDSKSKNKTKTKNNKNKIISDSSNSGSDLMVTGKNTNKPTPSTKISITSDEEWEEQVSKIERRLTIADDGKYSFLSSLSANVPISKCDMSARIFRTNFKTHKDQLYKKLYKFFNEEIFDNALPPDMQLLWGDRMRKTAGFCYCKKITRSTGKIERSARIQLSTKVVDTADRLRDTLIHEMCHAATWIVNSISDGHGDYWKAWAFKALKKFPELPSINRCHSYAIKTKYTYKCMKCGYSIGRHSKSLDIERKCCGYCHGKFEVLINKTNKNGETKAVAATPKKSATGFALFVKENYGIYKSPVIKHGDVMKLLGQKFKELQVNKP